MSSDKNIDESWKKQDDLEKQGGEQTNEEKKIIVDDSWKDSVAKEEEVEEQALEAQADEGEVPEVNFLNYISSLAFQAMIFMGKIQNPITQEIDKNLKQAKFLIDTLAMIKDKTEGNLTEQESALLANTVSELQMMFVDTAAENDDSQQNQ